MAGSTVKIGVDVTQFKQGMQQAQQSAKTLQAQMKANEAQFKATGNQEQYLTNKSKLLKAELEAQKKAADNAKKALAAMDKEGVEPTSREYQQMERALAGANAAMYETQAAMNAVTVSETKAAGGASNLEKSLSSISRNVSLDAVTKGIDGISSAMEKAGKKAVELGKQIWSNIMDSAEYADNIATLATRTGLSIDEIQRMEYVADRFEAPVEQMAKTWKKVKMNMSSDSDEVAAAFDRLGVSTQIFTQGKNGPVVTGMRDYMDVFWETGEAIMRMTDASEQERIAQLLLGRSWDEMTTLFGEGREKYEAAMEGATVADEEAVQQAADLNDRMKELEKQWDTLKLQAIGELAPALKTAADAIGTLLDRLTTYLKSDDGQKQLQRISDALGKIFGNLSEINPDDVVGKFAGVMEKIQGAFTWIGDHWTDVETGLKAIGIAFGTIKIASFALNLGKVVSGFQTLWNGAHKPLPQIPGTDSGTSTTTTTTSGSGGGGILKTIGNGVKFAAQAAEGSFYALSPVAAIGLAAYGAYRDYNNIVKKGEERVEKLNQESQNFNGQTDPMLMAAWSLMGEMHGTDVQAAEQNAAWIAKVGKMFEDSHSSTAKTDPTLLYLESLIDQGRLNEDLYDRFDYAVRDLWKNGSDADITFLDFQELFQQFEDELARIAAEDAAKIPVAPTVEDPAAANQAISKEIGAVPVPIVPVMGGFTRKGEEPAGFANGIWSVPWDGYPAILHKGERVMPARENQQYTYNTYFGNVNLNNGLEIEALTESIDRRNRRQRSGYGS